MEKFCVKGYLKRSGKRVLSILLCACMIGTMIPITARAETEGTSMPSNGEVTCTCANLCTEDKVNSDCPVCGTEEADLSKCTGKVQSENNENQLNTGESEEAKNETELTITGWEWIDEEELINPETGILALPFANEETPAFFDDVVALLPTQIQATVVNEEDIEAEAASETITLGDWSCEEYPKEGAYSESYTFAAALPEGYVLSEEAKALNVLVELGGAQMYENEQTTGAFTVTDGILGTDYTYDNNNKVLTINTGTAITIKNTDPSTSTTDRIEVAENVSANITLAGVNIDVSASENTAAFKIASDSFGSVTITLADDSINTLKSGNNCAGLQKNGGGENIGKLTIQGGTNGTGKLIAEGGRQYGGAGIGGGNYGSGSNIHIKGGTVEATSNSQGAGIGGGNNELGNKNITISGGTVTATGGSGGAGIGGGNHGNGYNITISGGSVKAVAGLDANNIGGGADYSAVTPTSNGETPVYLLTIENPDSKEVLIDGVSYTPVNHKSVDGNDGNLYAYLTGEPHLVKVGEKTCFYVFNSDSKTFSVAPLIIYATSGGKLSYNTDYTYENNVLTIKSGTAVTIKNTNPSTATTDRIEVADGVCANITLAGVNIDVSSLPNIAAFKNNSVNYNVLGITLAEGSVNKLISGSNCAGLQMMAESNRLHIMGGGKLIATGGSGGAGIGGGYHGTGSYITIHGGTVTATGGSNGGAGIGGGNDGKGSDITILGGTVTATGSGGGAGIGGGKGSYGSVIVIKGGTVTATGSGGGAGIGGGYNHKGTGITISGGTVTATGGSGGGAGIGGGDYDRGLDIEISGGTVTATGGSGGGAGIGGGNGYYCSGITISGGTVTATGSGGGAGIGGGKGMHGENITIKGGTVTATGSGGGAGIGGGNGYHGSGITISGGTVTATGSGGGAGIGGGNGGTGSGSITMEGDAVLYTSSINGEHTFTKGVVYDGVTVSGDAGSYTLAGGVGTVYGNPNVSGFTTPTGSKLGTNLADTDYITVTVPDVDYTGAEALPTATVTVNKTALSKTLVQGTDYTVSISDNDKTNAGAKNATITAEAGSGNVGKTTKAFNVKPVDLSADKIKMTLSGIPEAGYVYDSNAKEPVPVVTWKRADDSEYTLIKDTDYTVSYSNNTNAYELLSGDEGYEAGKAPTVKITAKDGGNFSGSRSMNFNILLADMPGFTITPYSDSYDGADHAVVSITPAGGFTDYAVYYITDNQETWTTTMPTITDAGTLDFYVKVTKPNYKDWISDKQTAKVTPVALASSMISFTDENHYYTGQEVKPEITVTDSNRTLVSGTDYTVSYTNNTSVSTESSKAKVTITAANGNYTGSASAEFNIEYANVEYMNYCTVRGTEGKDGWYSSDVTIQNMTDPNSAWGALQFSDSPTGTFADSYTVSEEGERDVTIWFKQTKEGTGYIGSDATTVKIDKTAPDWTENGCGISVKENWWKSLLNTISFGLFYKDATVDVKACAKDNLSGIDAYYYYIDNSGSTTVKTKDELDALVNGSEFIKYSAESSESPLTGTKTLKSLSNEGKYVVYAYAVDMAGNRSAYICTSGVVLDTTAPTIRTITTPSKEALTLTDTSAKISFTGSEAGTCFYMVKKSSEPKPTSINDFAISSEDKGMTVWTAKTGVSSEVMTTESKQITLSNLSPNTPYILYLAAVDKAGNSTATIESVSFTTCKTMPTITTNPTICGTYGDKVEDMTLTDGVANYGGEEIAGTWAVTDSNKTDVPGVGTTDTYKVTFTPDVSIYGDIYDTVIVPVKPTVSKKAITVTIDDKAKTYGQANPAFTYAITAGELVSSDTNTDLGITLTCVANESSPVKAGGYAITGTSSSANYQVTVIPGVLTINKATPTITASDYTKTYGDIKFFLDAEDNSAEASLQYAVTESKDTSGGTVENDAVVTVDARGYVTIKGAGTAKITASLPETANYNAASKEITIVVNPAAYPPNMPGTTISVANSCEKVGDITLPNSWKWRDTDKDTTLAVGSPVTVTAEYNGVDKGNYENETVSVTITRSSCDHVAGEILYTGTDEKAPTCTTDGLGHRECTICHETIESGIVVKAAHKFSSAWTIDVAPTTTSEGSKSHHCTREGCEAKNDITVIPKLPSSSGGDSGNSGGSSGDGSGSTEDSGNTGGSTDTGNGNTNPGTVKPTVTPGTPDQGTNPAPGENPAPGTGNNNKPGSKPVTNTGETTEAPFIKGENGKEGWDVIRDEVNQTQEGKTVTVDMNGSTVVPGDVLDEIKGKDITIVFDMGNGITWSVNGQSITADRVSDIDFTVTTGTNTIPVDIINNVTGERYSTQISLAYDGEFGFTAVLSINVDAKNAGLYANLFYYNEKTGEMEFICYDEIAADGTAELTFTHASDYAIVIDTEPMDKGADGADGDKEEVSGTGNDSTQSGDGSTQNGTEAADGTWNPLWLLLIGTVVIVIGLGVFLAMKKKKPEDK